jgi:hypothetical protein
VARRSPKDWRSGMIELVARRRVSRAGAQRSGIESDAISCPEREVIQGEGDHP